MRGGELIRRARRQARLTQTNLAERLGTSQSVIVRWERGERSPAFETLTRALAACGYDLSVSLEPRDPGLDRSISSRLALAPAERVRANEELLAQAHVFRDAKRVRSNG